MVIALVFPIPLISYVFSLCVLVLPVSRVPPWFGVLLFNRVKSDHSLNCSPQVNSPIFAFTPLFSHFGCMWQVSSELNRSFRCTIGALSTGDGNIMSFIHICTCIFVLVKREN